MSGRVLVTGGAGFIGANLADLSFLPAFRVPALADAPDAGPGPVSTAVPKREAGSEMPAIGEGPRARDPKTDPKFGRRDGGENGRGRR